MDMYVDYDTLLSAEDKLEKVSHDLTSSAEQMRQAILASDGFLEGNQYENVRNVTLNCIHLTKRTSNNIAYAKEYLKKLEAILEEYGRCSYNG